MENGLFIILWAEHNLNRQKILITREDIIEMFTVMLTRHNVDVVYRYIHDPVCEIKAEVLKGQFNQK